MTVLNLYIFNLWIEYYIQAILVLYLKQVCLVQLILWLLYCYHIWRHWFDNEKHQCSKIANKSGWDMKFVNRSHMMSLLIPISSFLIGYYVGISHFALLFHDLQAYVMISSWLIPSVHCCLSPSILCLVLCPQWQTQHAVCLCRFVNCFIFNCFNICQDVHFAFCWVLWRNATQ